MTSRQSSVFSIAFVCLCIAILIGIVKHGPLRLSYEPVVVAYKVTYCTPTGEVKTLYTTRYRANDRLWVLDKTGTDYIIINGRYIIEPIVK